MFWAALVHSSGILAGVHLWRPALWALASFLFAMAAMYFVSRRAGLGWILALGVFFFLGALHVQGRDARSSVDTSILPYINGQPLWITAHVITEGHVQPGGLGEIRQALKVESEQITNQTGLAVPVHSGIKLNIYSKDASDQGQSANLSAGSSKSSPRTLEYGERLLILAKLKLPRNFRNPGAFDYEGYLRDRGIVALGSAKLEDVEVLKGFSGNRVNFFRSRMHRGLIAKVRQLWPAREAALIDAMVIGEQSFIDRDTRTDFQRSGTYHVLVVSGMNVSILAFVVFWTLQRLRLGDTPCTLLTEAFCVTYAFVTEVGAPVWRATLMCAVYLGTRLHYRDRAMLNALGAAALGLLVFDPRQLFTASFQTTCVCSSLPQSESRSWSAPPNFISSRWWTGAQPHTVRCCLRGSRNSAWNCF